MERVGQSLAGLVESFLLSKQVSGCTTSTLKVYKFWLNRLLDQTDLASLDGVTVRRFFALLRERQLEASSIHEAHRTLKTLFLWLVATGTREEPSAWLPGQDAKDASISSHRGRASSSAPALPAHLGGTHTGSGRCGPEGERSLASAD